MLTHGCGRQGHQVRLRAFVGGAILVCLVGPGARSFAQVGNALPAGDERIGRIARVASGAIEGMVSDESGQPLAGATVSALGATTAASVTDTRGRFSLRMLPAGSYVLRAHLSGFVPSRRQMVDVRPNGYTRQTFSLQREMIRTASLADDPALGPVALGARPAGTFPGADRSGTALPPATPAEDDHSETAWRIRHLTRNVLKETNERAAPGDPASETPAAPAPWSPASRMAGSTTRGASSLFNVLPINGEINLLTMGALDDPLAMLSPQNLMNSVAYVSLRGPASSRGDWSARMVIAQADITSWFFSGAYRSRAPGRHVFDVGVSYGLLRSATPGEQPANFWSRSAGTVYAIDRWAITRNVSVAYGGSFSTYDYLPAVGYLSPRASVTVVPARSVRIQATVARSVVAPGSDEFLQPLADSLWVPAPRSFVALGSAQAAPIERVQHYEVSVEHDLAPRYVLAFRTFYQQVSDQQSVLFGSWAPFPVAGQQYVMTGVGDLNTRGWSVGLSNAISSRIRGSVWYALTESAWGGAPIDGEVIALVRLPAGHPAVGTERLHDLTTQLETEIPGTATHVFAVYKINTGFARRMDDAMRPGFDTRFDLQVTQPLPFLDFTSAQWQVLFAVRNLFRDATTESSVYDELLIVRPPKRIVGGLMVRF